MNPADWNDLQVQAYVDGELDAQTTARIEADSHLDASLAARIMRQRELRRLLREGFAHVLDEPVPQRLRAAAAAAPAATVIAFEAARRARAGLRPAWSVREWMAIAATLVIGTVLGSLALRIPGSLPLELVRGRLVARAALESALSNQLAGTTGAGAAVRIGLSVRAADGAYCRIFYLHTGAAGLACRRDAQWIVQLLDASAARGTAQDGYRQAGSSLSPAMLGAIGALGAGEALTREQEQQQVRAGWESPRL